MWFISSFYCWIIKKTVKKTKKDQKKKFLSCFSSVSCLLSLLDTGVVFSHVTPLPLLSSSFSLNGGVSKKKGIRKVFFVCFLSRMQLALMLFLSVRFTLYYHYPSFQLLHSTDNVKWTSYTEGLWGRGPCGRGAAGSEEREPEGDDR